MTKKELVDAITAETGLSKAKTNAFFKSFTETAVSVLAKGDVLILDGLGELAPAKDGAKDVELRPDPALLDLLEIEADAEAAPEAAVPKAPAESEEKKPQEKADSCEDLFIRNWYKTYWTGC